MTMDFALLRTPALWTALENTLTPNATSSELIEGVVAQLNMYLCQMGAGVLLVLDHYKWRADGRVVGLRISLGRHTETISLFSHDDDITFGYKVIWLGAGTVLRFVNAIVDELERIEAAVDALLAEVFVTKSKARADA
jgi:hypothetical protein